MPINPNIALSYAPATQLESPMNVMAKIQAMRAGEQENALRQVQMQNYQNEMARRNALLPYEQQKALAEAETEALTQQGKRQDIDFAFWNQQRNFAASVQDQPSWTAWRNQLVAKQPWTAGIVPEAYSSEAKQAALMNADAALERASPKLTFEQTASGVQGLNPYTGKPVGPAQPLPPKAPGTVVNVNPSNEFSKTIGENAAKQLDTLFTQAQSAQTSLENSDRLAPLLNDKNFIAGTLGDVRLTVAKALGLKGAAETQTYFAGIGQQVAERIKAFGAGTGLSDADRKYAEKVAGGSIELTVEALKKIVEINNLSAKNVIAKYRDRREFLSKTDNDVKSYYPDVELPAKSGKANESIGQAVRKTASGVSYTVED